MSLTRVCYDTDPDNHKEEAAECKAPHKFNDSTEAGNYNDVGDEPREPVAEVTPMFTTRGLCIQRMLLMVYFLSYPGYSKTLFVRLQNFQ